MNVKVNKEISELKDIKNFKVNGSGSDESLSIGACYAYCFNKNLKIKPNNLYLIKSLKSILRNIDKLDKKKYLIKKIHQIFILQIIKNGLILGRCKGKMEFGSRALGNRSIIANPNSADTISKINKKIKSRDF